LVCVDDGCVPRRQFYTQLPAESRNYG